MRRKMLIAIILIFAILLQSVVPLLSVNASTSYKITLTDNSELYEAVKNSLTEQGISATYSSSKKTITISSDDFENITYLDLSNSEIDDLTGLSQFTNVTSLNLTANELTVDSNLSELDSLPLEKLNLSSNKLESVSSITTFSSIAETDITNQEVTTKEVIYVDISDESDEATTYTVTLPDILLEDTGEIDADWIDAEITGNAVVNWATVSGNTVIFTVASGSGDSYAALSGLITITINVEDSTSKLANTKMNLYYVITDSDHTGIIFEDEYFYDAVKYQLTATQTENEELSSYGSSGTTLYDAAYDECLILVIDNNTIINDIPSLILNDKRITDLTGLEEFVGLDTELDLSYNYIETIEKIIELDENKEIKEQELQEKYSNYISILSTYVTSLNDLNSELETLEAELDSLESAESSSASDIASKQTEIANCEAKIVSYTALVKQTMEKLYDIYENEYLLTGIVPAEIMTLTSSEISNSDLSTLEEYAESIISKITTLEESNALTSWEQDILEYVLESLGISVIISVTVESSDGTTTDVAVENPISTALSTWIEGSDLFTKSDYVNFIEEMIIASNVIVAGNQCLLEQYYGDETSCTFSSTFSTLISDLESISLDTTFATLAKSSYSSYTSECLCESTDSDLTVVIAAKLVNIGSEEIETYIKLPRLKNLNLQDNSIESLAGLEALEELETLNVYKNLLDDITDVDWSVFVNLEDLNLGYNQLSDINCLEVLTSLVTLNLSNNLISGNFDFYLVGMSNLKTADFSNNQISNISYYINQYKFLAKAADMDIEEYLLSSSSPTVSFQYQTLSMSTTVVLDGSFITIDLPSIFEQAETIDYSRTSFGIDSLLGTVSSDGTTVKLYTPSTGSYEAVVTIEGYNGNSYSTSGIAYGTTCTIEYVVVEDTEEDVEDEEDTTETEDTDSTDDTDTVDTDDTDTDTTEDTDTTIEYNYTIEDDYVIVTTPGITLSEFAETLVETEGYTVTVTNSSNAIDDYLATGAVVSIDTTDGEEVTILEIVVLGDVNGDGEVDALDSGIVKNVINDVTELVGVYYDAADVNRDGDIDRLDSVLILQYRADKISSF